MKSYEPTVTRCMKPAKGLAELAEVVRKFCEAADDLDGRTAAGLLKVFYAKTHYPDADRVVEGEPGWDVIAARQMAAELVHLAACLAQEADK